MLDGISPDIAGLLSYHENISGIPSDTILIISLLQHYPRLFKQLNLSIFLPIILKKDSVIQIYDQLSTQKNKQETQDTFPSKDTLIPVLQEDPLFSNFAEENCYLSLVESLIILFHFSVQPEYILASALRQEAKYYDLRYLYISSSMIDEYLELVQFMNHRTRRLDCWFELQLAAKNF